MWSRNESTLSASKRRRLARFGAVALLAAMTAGCFQPLHATAPVTGGPSVRDALAAVEVAQIEAPKGSPQARIAVEIRDQLLFALTGGSGSASPTHRLVVDITLRTTPITVDITSGRAEVEVAGIDARYRLVNIATGKQALSGTTFARVTSDVPGQQQRFARVRAQRDAEERAARVIADHIRLRLASALVAGS
jgi:LPS-assembly lipoprotein